MGDKLPMHWCRISSIKRITRTSLPKLQHSSQLEAAWTKSIFSARPRDKMPDVPGSLSWKLGKSVVTLTLEKSFEALMLGRHMSITHDLLTWADEKRLERRNHELPPCTRGFHKRVCHLATRCLSWLKISCWVEKKVTFENWGPPQMHTARTCWFEEGNQQQIFKTSSHGTSVKSPHLIVSRFLKNAESSILLYGCDNFSQKMYEENRKTSDHCLWLVVLCSKSYSDFLRLPDWFLMPLLKNGPGMPSETWGTTLCLCAG